MANSYRDPSDILEYQPANGISVIIVGSGIGGLTAARECLRIGCSVRVFERQPGPVYTGDSFTIGSSAVKSLHKYPSLYKQFKKLGVQPYLMVHKLDGTKLKGPVEMTALLPPSVGQDVLSDYQRISRPKIYGAMLDHLERTGVQVEYGREVVDYCDEADEGQASVTFKDGSKEYADLVVAADGVNGKSWKLILGSKKEAAPSGDAVFRTSPFSLEQALKIPGVVENITGTNPRDKRPFVRMYLGDIQLYMGILGDMVEWSIVRKDDGRAQESWEHRPSIQSVHDFLDQYPGLSPDVKALISTTPADKLVDWRIMWRDPQPQWTSADGRVLQLGDAAHVFHPSSGSGATQAMEDAVSLATCLSIAGKEDLMWATRVHNKLRFERVSCLQAFGIANQAERVKSGGLPAFGRWIATHDPEKYARDHYEEALSHVRDGTEFSNTNTPAGMVYEPWTIHSLLSEEKAAVLQGDWS